MYCGTYINVISRITRVKNDIARLNESNKYKIIVINKYKLFCRIYIKKAWQI